MRHIPLAVMLLLPVAAGSARAQAGVNLSWDDCGAASLRGSAAFAYPPQTCYDPMLGCLLYGLAIYTPGHGGPDRAQIVTTEIFCSMEGVALPAGIESYSFELVLQYDKTVGPGSCEGCQAPACIVLNTVDVYTLDAPPADHVAISNPIQRNYVTWQGGTSNCPGATPVINRTWGSLKSAYR